MSERKGPRFALLALTTAVLVGALGYYFASPAESVAGQTLDQAKSERKLESLTELDGKAPTNRKLNVQTWQTAEGSKVLFVEARELPMFDLSLTFAAGCCPASKCPPATANCLIPCTVPRSIARCTTRPASAAVIVNPTCFAAWSVPVGRSSMCAR